MFTRQATYLATVREKGFALPETYDDHADAWDDVRRALAASPRPTVPCNNDLLAANFIDDGERVWLIDYEYSGNNDACFELGNAIDRVQLHPGDDRGLDRGVLRDADPRGPGPGPPAGAVQPVRLVAVGVHPGGQQHARLRLLRAGAMERFDKAEATFRGPELSRCWTRSRTTVAEEVDMTDLPSRAEIVVIGGGVIGASVAYHLTKLGRADVLLLEQGHLSGGTTWHAAGLVGPLRASESGTRLVQYSAELYASLEAETGLSTGYRNVGGVIVARTEDRMVQLRRTAANATAYDMECELVSPERAQELWPVMQVDDLLGALWLPGDGKVNPTDLTQSLAKGARQGGAKVAERVRVTGFATDGRRVTAVETDQGSVECEVVVNCAGQWAKALGDLVGVTVPLHSCEHFYVVTEAVEGTHPDLPIMRDPDGWTYFKEEVGGLVVGGFEPEAKPWRAPDDLPYPFEFQLLEEDWEHFAVLMDEAVRRIPVLAETGIRKFYNGPESFTPDNQFLLGRAPELDNYFVGAGFNSVGIASAGGAGRALAEWVVGRRARRRPHQRRRTAVRAVGGRTRLPPRPGGRDPRPALRPAVAEPRAGDRPRRTALAAARPAGRARCGLRHQERLGAAALLRRASWTTPGASRRGWPRRRPSSEPAGPGSRCSTRRRSRSTPCPGRGALEALQWVCAADVDVPVGHVVYTPWLNERGTYEADLTVTRDGPDSFWVVSSSATTVRDLDWLRRMGGLEASDETDAYAVLGVMGPAAPDLLGWYDFRVRHRAHHEPSPGSRCAPRG